MKLATSRSRATRRAAFTLLEVLVVVAILVILAGVATVATTRYLEDARKSKAQLQSKAIAVAVEAFYANANSNGNYPSTLQELVTPPWGGSSFLKDAQTDFADPWGRPGDHFMLEFQNTDNSQMGSPIIKIQAPDGTPISQYGIGNNALVIVRIEVEPNCPGIPSVQPSGAAMRATRFRPGFTLIELLLVIALLLILAAITLPSFSGLKGNADQKAAADTLRARIADARGRAMEHSVPYRLAVNTDGTKLRFAPEGTDFGEMGADNPPAGSSKAGEDTLDKATITVTADGEMGAPGVDSTGWITIATFLPDGTCREDSVIVEVHETNFPSIRIHIRGVTGGSRVLAPQKSEGMK